MRFSLLFPLAVALALTSSASALELSRTLPATDVAELPYEVRFLIFDGPEAIDPLEIADFGPGQYRLDEQGRQVVISAELLQDLDPEGLWIETELDGQTKGERVALRVFTPGVTFGVGNDLNMDGNTITGLVMPAAPGEGGDMASRAYVEARHDLVPPDGTSPGDMQYWNGSAWVLIPAPAGDKDMLSISGEVPTWIDRHTYSIGDTGPAGGIVFLVFQDDEEHGLEAALADQGTSPLAWGCHGTSAGAYGVEVGTGAINTASILAACGDTEIPARLAAAYTQNGFSDYFLPSRTEFAFLYIHRAFVGATAEDYWTSSEVDATSAWLISFNNQGKTFILDKNSQSSVRAIRAF